MNVRYVTKGGAYNLFNATDSDFGQREDLPETIKAVMHDASDQSPIRQMVYGISLDNLFTEYRLQAPTHLKIDVDGLEPWIIQGAQSLLAEKRLRTILIEINRKSNRDIAIPDILAAKGFQLSSERCNWLSRDDRTKEDVMPATNMIFSRRS